MGCVGLPLPSPTKKACRLWEEGGEVDKGRNSRCAAPMLVVDRGGRLARRQHIGKERPSRAAVVLPEAE